MYHGEVWGQQQCECTLLVGLVDLGLCFWSISNDDPEHILERQSIDDEPFDMLLYLSLGSDPVVLELDMIQVQVHHRQRAKDLSIRLIAWGYSPGEAHHIPGSQRHTRYTPRLPHERVEESIPSSKSLRLVPLSS